jgi:bifunctional N-acetylglucosamine-1-phosphate-uridyltransferase/glucosamine-1-phosphate-acetyltransferase GlmU-like protein
LEALNAQSAEIVCGTFLFSLDWLSRHFHKIVKSEDSGELLLTSLIRTAHDEGTPAMVYKLEREGEWSSVNTPDELKIAAKLKRRQLDEN